MEGDCSSPKDLPLTQEPLPLVEELLESEDGFLYQQNGALLAERRGTFVPTLLKQIELVLRISSCSVPYKVRTL